MVKKDQGVILRRERQLLLKLPVSVKINELLLVSRVDDDALSDKEAITGILHLPGPLPLLEEIVKELAILVETKNLVSIAQNERAGVSHPKTIGIFEIVRARSLI